MRPRHRAPARASRASRSLTLVPRAQESDPVLDFANSVMRGLHDRPRWLPCRFLYDAEGSRLFDRICDTPEYYLTRVETDLLARHASALSRLTGPATLVELGSGSGRKTSLVLDAYHQAHGPGRYVPVDVSEQALRESAKHLAAEHPDLSIQAWHGTYESAFPLLERYSPLVLLFLGSTVGNLNQTEAAIFWGRVAHALAPGDFVVLGADLAKSPELLNPAYNDAAGWSAAFTKNIFVRMNRELGSGIDLESIEHQAAYREDWRRIEIFARFTRRQTIQVKPLGQSVTVEAGEQVMTEISRKFDVPELRTYLATFGLDTVRVFTDPQRWYALLVLRRSDTDARRGHRWHRAPSEMAIQPDLARL